MNEEPVPPPSKRKALLSRLLGITLVLLPISYVVFSLLVKSWVPYDGTDESIRHILEWLGVLAGGIGLTFCISLLPLRGRRGFFYLFSLFATGAFLVFLVIGVTSGKHYPAGPLLLNCLLAAIVGGLAAAALFIGIGWLCCWKNFRRFLFSVACIATLIGLVYAEENWRGRRAWENYKQEREAKGEQFDFADFIPPAVPDDQNFAFSPVWIAAIKWNFHTIPERAKSWYGNLIDDAAVEKFLPLMPVTTSTVTGTNPFFSQPPENSRSWTTANFYDLKPFQTFYHDEGTTNPASQIIIAPQPQTPAQDILLALSKFDPVIGQLQKDNASPGSRFPVKYDDEDPAEILLPHLAAVKTCSMVLRLRALAGLQNGETNRAFSDTMLSLRMADAIKTEPFIITHLVRLAILNLALQPVYEGLAEHKWSDAQLAAMDAEFAKLDFLSDYERSTKSECAAHAKVIDWMAQRRSRFWNLYDMVYEDERKEMNHFWLTTEVYLMPRGWFYQSDIAMSEVHRQWIEPMVDETNQTVSPQLARKATAAVGELKPTAMNLFARLLLPELGKYAMRVAYGQTAANEARIAIALERYRHAHGNFPDSLEALVPQCLEKIPQDVIGGLPLKYARTEDGSFVLYSVGWNEVDDGGTVGYKTDSSPHSIMDLEAWNGPKPPVDLEKGDWVWRYPQK